MKSERAKKYIDNDAIVMRNGDRMVDASTAYIAIELAEQDAEMRMREKAIKAYCSECACYETGACALDPDKCATKLLFVQNMTEE